LARAEYANSTVVPPAARARCGPNRRKWAPDLVPANVRDTARVVAFFKRGGPFRPGRPFRRHVGERVPQHAAGREALPLRFPTGTVRTASGASGAINYFPVTLRIVKGKITPVPGAYLPETAVVNNFVEKENIQPLVRNSKNPPGHPQTATGTSTVDSTRRACRAPRAYRRPNRQIVWIVAMPQLGAWHA